MSRAAGDAAYLRLETSWGVVDVFTDGRAVIACSLPEIGDSVRRNFSLGSTLLFGSSRQRPLVKMADRFVRAALVGEAAPVPPLRFEGTPWQRAVWRVLQALSRGEVASYGEVAARMGHPRAARAVGAACGSNPLPLFIPCHRIVAANGRLGGFSGGLAWKRHLLEREGVTCA
ncbi:MAG TPA: methylated-DNA--[protein]-cysteine S-methyltransferase [Kiritimatiellia bacterium]|nr:methylated-DNA--[protein]-cysteine S-methyltransferase [Kiritimatiellia bacterium]HMP00319.1 methylated-DNA--[protein]-cysteine S-methyltransferase [Kiritimatiellia bacterium]